MDTAEGSRPQIPSKGSNPNSQMEVAAEARELTLIFSAIISKSE
jgi:hypothetical protein